MREKGEREDHILGGNAEKKNQDMESVLSGNGGGMSPLGAC